MDRDAVAELQHRLDARGIDGATVVEHGAGPIAAHVTGDVTPWLAALERYASAVAARPEGSLWSALRFAIGPLLDVAAGDPVAFAELLDRTAAIVTATRDSRFEQYAIPAAGSALAGRPVAMRTVLDTAIDLGIELGWFVQLVVPPLASAAPDDDAFATAWHAIAGLARSAHSAGVHVGYPLGLGVAALVARGELDTLPAWLDVLAPLARAARDRAYPLFEYGVTGVAQDGLAAHDVTDALKLALAMIDHGLWPGPTLAALRTPVQLDVATRLAKAGVEPVLVVTNGLALFERHGWLGDGGERLVAIATELHRRGLRQLLFDDGVEIIDWLEAERGLGERALALVEAMIARDLEPGVVMRWSLPRTLGRLSPTWAAAELLWLAEQLVAAGIEPEPAIDYAARPLVELAADVAEFRALASALIELVVRLDALGVDHKNALFHDVGALADTGGESRSFVELLAAVAALLAAWTAAGLDPTELLQAALPAAARECAGRPWLLASALATATRLAHEDRGNEALALLVVGVHTATELGATTTERFVDTLAALEARYAALPAQLTTHASAAAGVLAGTDVGELDRALAALGDAHTRHGDVLVAIGPALPDLARIAGDCGMFASLVDAVVALGLGARAARLAAVVALIGRGDARGGERALAALASLTATPAHAATLDVFVKLAHVTSLATLAECVALVHAALDGLADRRRILDLLAYARDEDTLRRMCALLPPLFRDGRYELLDGLYAAHQMVARNRLGWAYLVAPAIATAKVHAGPLLYALSLIPPRAIELEADAAVIRELVTQRGVRAIDLIINLVLPALGRYMIESLADHRELLERYLREVGFSDPDVYAHFVAIARDASPDAARRVAALRGEIAALTAAIRSGDVAPEQRAHPLFGVALQHVFPASVSVTRRAWEELVATMPDRPDDVTAVFPGGHATTLELACGGWQLVAGATELDVFAWCANVLPDRDTPEASLAELGWQLVTAWADGRLARQRLELARGLLAHAPAGTLPAPAYDSAAQLLAIRALAADRLASLVEQAVVAARADDAERVDRLVRTRLAPTPRIGPGLVKSVARTLDAVRRGALDANEADRRLRGQLQAFELPGDAVAQLAAAPDLAAALIALAPRAIEIEAGKEVARIHAELVGQELQQMTAAIARVVEYRASADVLRIDATVTKRAIHAPIGFVAGVCVATDLELWNTRGFMHLALWDGNVCVGSVHLLVLAEADRRYLALPGINPSGALLDRVEPAELVRVLLAHARQLAHAAGLAGVWIPTSPSIHSNRHALSPALAALELPVRHTQSHAFSYRPYAYRIDDVWEAS